METGYKSLSESAVNYAVETNKQLYDFSTKMMKNYIEFSSEFAQSASKLVPGMEAWSKLVPAPSKK